jgi:hypothetical protein
MDVSVVLYSYGSDTSCGIPPNEEERGGGGGHGVGQHSGAASGGSGPAAARAGIARRAAGRTGEGEAADRWAAATVPGGGTG